MSGAEAGALFSCAVMMARVNPDNTVAMWCELSEGLFTDESEARGYAMADANARFPNMPVQHIAIRRIAHELMVVALPAAREHAEREMMLVQEQLVPAGSAGMTARDLRLALEPQVPAWRFPELVGRLVTAGALWLREDASVPGGGWVGITPLHMPPAGHA